METKDYLDILKNKIHSTIIATIDSEGKPVTRVIDIMLVDHNTFYFLTAKGKDFYEQLMKQKYISLSAYYGGETYDKKEASIHMKSITIKAYVKNIGTNKLDEIFKENPYMNEIYPSDETKMALTVFCAENGVGEFFDLTTKPITRNFFYLGSNSQFEIKNKRGYFINENCVCCDACIRVCPQSCIEKATFYRIIQENCIHCGNCLKVCNFDAVVRR